MCACSHICTQGGGTKKYIYGSFGVCSEARDFPQRVPGRKRDRVEKSLHARGFFCLFFCFNWLCVFVGADVYRSPVCKDRVCAKLCTSVWSRLLFLYFLIFDDTLPCAHRRFINGILILRISSTLIGMNILISNWEVKGRSHNQE